MWNLCTCSCWLIIEVTIFFIVIFLFRTVTNKCTIITHIFTFLHVLFFVSLTSFVPSSLFIHYPSFSIPSCFIYLFLPLPSLHLFCLSSPLFYLSSTIPLYALSTSSLLSYIFSPTSFWFFLHLRLRLSVLNLSSFLSFIFFLFSSCTPQTVKFQGSLTIGTDIHVTFKHALFEFL